MDEHAELRALVDALAMPSPSPSAARARLHDLCTKEIGHVWRQRLGRLDPVTAYENAVLRLSVARDELECAIVTKGRRLYPDLAECSADAIATHVRNDRKENP